MKLDEKDIKKIALNSGNLFYRVYDKDLYAFAQAIADMCVPEGYVVVKKEPDDSTVGHAFRVTQV